MGYDLSALRAMTPARVENETGLRIRVAPGEDQSEADRIAERIRDGIAELIENGDVSEYDADALTEWADGMVPVYTADRMRWAYLIESIWHEEDETGGGGDLVDFVGRLLFQAIEQAGRELLAWAESDEHDDQGNELPEDDDDDEDEDD